MSDNVTANSGSGGAVFATDDISGVHYPIQKLGFGALDSVTLVTSSAGLPVAQQGTWTVSLPTGASTAAKQPALGTAGTASADVITVQGIASMTALKVDGSGVTQPVSNAGTFAVQAAQSGTWNITNISGTVSLPTGAATAAKQPALGTAGTPSSDVLTVQGATSMTALKVDGSAVAQPITDNSGSLTVDGTVSVSGLVPGTSATSLGKAEDAAAGDGDTGVMALAIRKDTAATTVGADGDYHPLEVDGSGRLWTNGSAVTQPVSNAGTFAVQAAQSGTWNVATLTTITNVVHVDDNSGSLTIDAPVGTPAFVRLSDGSSAISTLPVSLASVPSHAVTNAGTFAVQNTPATSGGLTPYKLISAGSTNATSVKASAGQLFGLYVSNINASPRYLKLYDKASAPSVGSDIPVLVLPIPGDTSLCGLTIQQPLGIAFSLGIAFALTSGVADNDTGAVSASEHVVNLLYK